MSFVQALIQRNVVKETKAFNLRVILNITAKHPVLLELCSYEDLNKAIVKSGGDPTASEVQVNAISELP